MSYQAGDTYLATVTVRDEAGAVTDPDTLTLSIRDPLGIVLTYEYGVDDAIIRDSEGVYHSDVALIAAGMWVIEWATSGEGQVEGIQVAVSPAPVDAVTFATIDELALRLGYAEAGDLSAAQQAQGLFLLEMATGLIVETVGKTTAWAATLNPIPRILRGICLEAVARVMRNPSGVSSESETLGAYSHTTRYEFTTANAPVGMGLTDDEGRRCRRAVYGTVSGSAYPTSVLSAP